MSGQAQAGTRRDRLDALFARTHAGIKPGLELTRALLDALGAPEQSFLCVHVAGTNGKGSVCAITEALLCAMGLRTGRFTSPHLLQVNERFCIDGSPIDDDTLFALLDRVDAAAEGLERRPTFFETCTALAFLAFADAGVQVAVIETGMGGRWDSTNVVTPLLSVITPVGLDHIEFLGDTLGCIAAEKAGIIKEGRPVVLGNQQPDAREVLEKRAADQRAPLVVATERVSVVRHAQTLEGQSVSLSTHAEDFGRMQFPLLGDAQIEALTTALATVEQVATLLPPLCLTRAVLLAGLELLHWPARFEVLGTEPPVILDVAHNPAGAAMLTRTIRDLFGRNARGILIIAAMQDKDLNGMLDALLPVVSEAFAVPLSSPRALPPETLAAALEQRGRHAEVRQLDEALQEARRRAGKGDSFVLVAGSVYLAGELIAARQASEDAAKAEPPDAGETR